MQHHRRNLVVVVVVVFMPLLCASYTAAQIGSGPKFKRPSGIAVEASGDLVVTDIDLNAVLRVDATTGNRLILSDVGVGAGTAFALLQAIAVEASGDLVAVDQVWDAVIRVDPVTGDRTIVSDPSTGAGAPVYSLFGIAVEASGNLVVTDPSAQAVLRVDPVTGDRTTVSRVFGGVGSGPNFDFPDGIAVEASGDLVVADSELDAVIRVDPVTGDRTIVSGRFTGSGPKLISPEDIAVEASGDLVVTGRPLFGNSGAVFRVDPVTGDRTIVSDASTGMGPLIGTPGFSGVDAIAVDASGDLVVADSDWQAVLRVDSLTGDRTMVSIGGCPSEPPTFVVSCDTPAKTLFRIKDKNGDGAGKGDKLLWKLINGPAATQADFGDPSSFASYAMCLYSDFFAGGGNFSLAMEAIVAAAGTCAGNDCWAAISTKGYKFKDKDALQDGIFKIILKGKAPAARTKLLFKGKGDALDLDPFTLPIPGDNYRALALNFAGAKCWATDFHVFLNNVTVNTHDEFTAKYP